MPLNEGGLGAIGKRIFLIKRKIKHLDGVVSR